MDWTYDATVLKIVDGDTLDVDVDLGFDVHMAMRLRLNRIDTPELNSKDPAEREAAAKAKARLAELAPVGKTITVVTFKNKKEKYGRYLAELFITPPLYTAEPIDASKCINDVLLIEGLAKLYGS